jgi:DNA (cytosine-5)-methyltransferase 1
VNEPTHLDLFSGIGGFALAARWAGFRTIGFCEIDKYCQKVLAKNFLADAAGRYNNNITTRQTEPNPCSPVIMSDIRELDGRTFAGVTLITGGFPCQPFSCAGKRRGKEDDRHLWPEMLRVIAEARPTWVLGENVTGIIGMELDSCLSDLETIGYATRPFVIPACGVDAKHRRNRVWIVANAQRDGCSATESRPGTLQQPARSGGVSDVAYAQYSDRRTEHKIDRETHGRHGLRRSGQDVADNESQRLQGKRSGRVKEPEAHEREGISLCNSGDGSVWSPEPDVGRVANGIPNRVHRLKGLGNAIVPQVAYQILRAIAQIERGEIE